MQICKELVWLKTGIIQTRYKIMKNVHQLKQKYSEFDVSQLKMFLIAIIGEYTSREALKARRNEIANGTDNNIFNDYNIEIKVILDLIQEKLNQQVSG